ncbi:PREDICTED: NAD-dependent protein deacetylase sirtuin-2-like isoform X1 [Amphimedon queenslandica]|uniref:Deacetylase sirtuin-type domain-containing protein n=1 Tax=Amphimedon queenslandica TaxID=400682 RepID=A0AAN0JW37_AMPQE|nr:PREDICTED: NAD-dependent protein deacetylase sirtuin-2-like isoform X1 [Amphimedon queenslandica]XP_019861131.1 PREDICTED: NAD-dependent protein deacetylase sirtuin-2-like isoform X1 [Amphimedon queenslandica]XP_019861132.1 PREDICTED: NAD-dependent protein deacetylase sirtuin-2-like isoform X1 [Amphimedon queenslandica]XP_019861133.1 PREDICTED: NAD-dependent protein deacetylase sirtuin-2-like isoform X1 [Amphimedon queenslandica]|eukprot:XP_019861130.1 PREDICTED: NAD-dependent protein deacetylase sirtuin-2-like isoform X1 [Amphimedon queenslandica]
MSFFQSNPRPFFSHCQDMYLEISKVHPTLCHYFIRLLEANGLLLRCYTENIDTLERRAGITDEHLVKVHGALDTAHCITCGKGYSYEFVKAQAGNIPFCTSFGCAYEPKVDSGTYKGIVKPDVVFVGEDPPRKFTVLANEDFQNCKLLIIIGTSLTAKPFASLPSKVRDDCPRLVINNKKFEVHADPLSRFGTDFNFGVTAYRDVFLRATCNEGVLTVAKKIGLGEDLMELYKSESRSLGMWQVEEVLESEDHYQLKEKDWGFQMQRKHWELQEKNREYQEKDKELQEKYTELQEKDRELQEKDRELQVKDREHQVVLQDSQEALRQKDRELQENKKTLQQKDIVILQKDRELRQSEDAVRRFKQQALTDDHWVINKDEVTLTKEELGRGGYAVVKVGIFRGLRVAVKSLHTVIISDYNLAYFSREMSIASQVVILT